MIQLPLLPPHTVHRTVLPNGLTLVVRHDDSAPVVAIVTFVKAGYFDEPDDVVGIAHVLEHMYFKGTERRGVGEISKETKAAGGFLNAGTIYDHTSYYAVLPSAGFVRGLEIQADAYASSLIDAGELAKELEVIIQEAKRKADNPSAVAIETLYEVLHDRHRMRRWRIGREEGLRVLTRAHVHGFYRQYYRPRNTVLVIAGHVDPDAARHEVERLYGGLPDAPVTRDEGPEEADRAGFRYRELAGDITQTQIALGWRTPGTLHPDTPPLELAASALGSGRASRLYRAVRERKLAASVSAYDYTPTSVGVFAVHAEGPPETSVEAARAIWEQVRDLREGGIGQDELWRSRRIFESRWIRRLETMEGQANHIAYWEALGDWMLGDRFLERLLTVSAEQVTDAVRRYLTPDRCGLVLYRPASAPPVATDALAIMASLGAPRPEPLAPVPPLAASAAAVHNGVPPLEREVGRVRVYRTRQDVPIVVRRKGGVPLVHFGVYARGGATDERAEVAGLTTMLCRTAIKGTERRAAMQIAEEAELLGGSINSGTSAESFGWSLSVPSASAAAALDLLADVVQRATIEDDALATERAVAIAELALARDDMFRHPIRLVTQAAFEGHPYGIPVTGSEASIAGIHADQVRAWHRERVLEAPTVVAIVGDVDPDDAAEAAARFLGELRMTAAPSPAEPAWPTERKQAVEQREKAQTALALAFPAPARTDDERFAARLLATVASGLGGRFFDELRDRQSLAYTVHAFASERERAGLFISYIATSPEKEEVARRGLLTEFAKLRERPVTRQELAQAKEYSVGTHAIRQQSGSALLADLLDAWLFGDLAELDEYESRIRAVSARSMMDVARRYFDDGRLVEGIIRGVGREV